MPDKPLPDLDTRSSCLALMRLSKFVPGVAESTAPTPVAGTVDVTIIAVADKKIFTQSGYWHGGINE